MKYIKKCSDDWVAIFKCVHCENNMTYNTKMYSAGVCPFCGSSSGCSVCDTKTVAARKFWMEARLFGFIPIKKNVRIVETFPQNVGDKGV